MTEPQPIQKKPDKSHFFVDEIRTSYRSAFSLPNTKIHGGWLGRAARHDCPSFASGFAGLVNESPLVNF